MKLLPIISLHYPANRSKQIWLKYTIYQEHNLVSWTQLSYCHMLLCRFTSFKPTTKSFQANLPLNTSTSMTLSSFGDKYGPRRALAVCLICSSLSMISFGYWNSVFMFSVLLFLNGTAQSTAWPNAVKSLTGWFSNKQRMTIFGLFGTSSFAGGILGTAMAVQLLSMFAPDMKMIFFIPSVIVGIVGILDYLFLNSPSELGIPDANAESAETPSNTPETGNPPAQLSYSQLWSLRMIPELSWATCCVKLVRYCMYMWLPMYLYQALNYTKVQAGYLSTVFEIGGVVGTTALGFVVTSAVADLKTGWNCKSWLCVEPLHYTQTDSYNCGVIVCLFARCLCEGLDINGSYDVDMEREGITSVIFGSCYDDLDWRNTAVCKICKDDDGEDWLGCDSCDQFFHASCLDVPFTETLTQHFTCP